MLTKFWAFATFVTFQSKQPMRWQNCEPLWPGQPLGRLPFGKCLRILSVLSPTERWLIIFLSFLLFFDTNVQLRGKELSFHLFYLFCLSCSTSTRNSQEDLSRLELQIEWRRCCRSPRSSVCHLTSCIVTSSQIIFWVAIFLISCDLFFKYFFSGTPKSNLTPRLTCWEEILETSPGRSNIWKT